MANVFKPKRSSTASAVPTTSDLTDGELAVNSADQKIYIRDGGTIVEVANVDSGISNVVEDTTPQLGGNLDLNSNDITGTGDVNITGIITATSFSGGGASLTSLNASNISSGTISDDRLPATITSNITGDLTGNADTATTSTNVTVADESTDTTCFPLFTTAATGDLAPKSGSNLTFNSSNGTLTATEFSGGGSNLTGLTGASAATYGDASNVAQIVVDANGRITGISNVAISGGGGGISNVVEDTTPQLGGNLDLNSNDITGTGNVNITGIITATSFVGGGSGLTGITASQVGALADIVEDTTPQLGGDLDLNSSDITGTGNVNITGTITASGDIQTDGAFRAESSNSTERFEIAYNETTDSLDFSYFAS